MKTLVMDDYICPMHPVVKSKSAGACTKWGMALVKPNPATAQTTHLLNEHKLIPENK